LVFGELAKADPLHKAFVLCGSAVMVAGVLAISAAVATEREQTSTNEAVKRECTRYQLVYDRVLAANEGAALDERQNKRTWWDYGIIVAALSVFIWLGKDAVLPSLKIDYTWIAVLAAIVVATALGLGWVLWKKTRFS
jgi:hypothetical protein